MPYLMKSYWTAKEVTKRIEKERWFVGACVAFVFLTSTGLAVQEQVRQHAKRNSWMRTINDELKINREELMFNSDNEKGQKTVNFILIFLKEAEIYVCKFVFFIDILLIESELWVGTDCYNDIGIDIDFCIDNFWYWQLLLMTIITNLTDLVLVLWLQWFVHTSMYI